MGGPLEGLIVADFTGLAQGPFATQMLGDMGAEIIKIEPPKGDWMRHWSMMNLFLAGQGASFLSFNRNKRSIALDLKHPRGKEVALRLIGAADVVIENFRPGVMDRLGLGYETLAEQFPRLIYCASSGWGQTGPYATRPGQDLLVQAVAGVGYMNGNADDRRWAPPSGSPISPPASTSSTACWPRSTAASAPAKGSGSTSRCSTPSSTSTSRSSPSTSTGRGCRSGATATFPAPTSAHPTASTRRRTATSRSR